jgi:hypothetical protein
MSTIIGGFLLLDLKIDESGGGSHRRMGFVRVDVMTMGTIYGVEGAHMSKGKITTLELG